MSQRSIESCFITIIASQIIKSQEGDYPFIASKPSHCRDRQRCVIVMHMPAVGQRTTVNEDGSEKDAYTVVFTNGALAELEELQDKIGANDIDAVIKTAIGLLKQIEENSRAHRTDAK